MILIENIILGNICAHYVMTVKRTFACNSLHIRRILIVKLVKFADIYMKIQYAQE